MPSLIVCKPVSDLFCNASTFFVGFCELSLPVKVPGVIVSGCPQIDVTLYEYICVHVSGFVANLPAAHFETLVGT